MTPRKQGSIPQGAANARRHMSSYTSDLARKKPSILLYYSSPTEKRQKLNDVSLFAFITPKRKTCCAQKER